MAWLQLLLGLGVLSVGADRLVAGASALALRIGVSPLWVGLTVVAFGTSAPELVVSSMAAVNGQGGIALGNVLGSNICNIGLILGLSALLRPMRVELALLRRDIPLLLLVSLVAGLVLSDLAFGRLEGTLFLLALAIWLVLSGRASQSDGEAHGPRPVAWWLAALWVAVGLGALVVGARVFVEGAVDLARGFGVSETVIGLTIVAVGTSMPELATSVVAAVKGHGDIAIGNVVGSNLFNLLGILGVSSLLAPMSDPGLSRIDLLVMLGFAALLLPLSRTAATLSRREGAVLLALYAGYVGWRVALT